MGNLHQADDTTLVLGDIVSLIKIEFSHDRKFSLLVGDLLPDRRTTKDCVRDP